MKKILLSAAAVMLLSLSLLMGCGSSAPETLEGTTWYITDVTIDGETYDVQQLIDSAGQSADSFVVTFDKDGQGAMNFAGMTESFSYTYEDGKLKSEGETYDVDGNTIKIEVSGMAMTLVQK